MSQGGYAARANIDRGDAEELYIRDRPAIHFLEDLAGIRSLNLEAVMAAQYALSFGTRRRAWVIFQAHIPFAIGCAEHQPVGYGGAANENEFILTFAKGDLIANDMTSRSYGDEVLGAVQIKIREIVDAVIGEEDFCLRTFHRQFIHMMRLVKQHGRLAPRNLFVAPILEFWGNHRIDILPDARIAQKMCGSARGSNCFCKTRRLHVFLHARLSAVS